MSKKKLFFTTRFLLICVFLLSLCTLKANTIKLSEQQDRVALEGNIVFLEDYYNLLSIEDIINNEFEYQHTKSNQLYFSYSNSTYWIRFTLENTSNTVQSYVISVENYDISHICFYETSGSGIIKGKASGKNVTNTEDLNNHFFIHNSQLEANSQKTFYLKIRNDGNSTIVPISVNSSTNFERQKKYEYSRDIFIYGFLFFIFLLSLFLTIRLKRQTLIYFSLHILFGSLYLGFIQGYIQFFTNQSGTWISINGADITLLLSNISFLLFANLFLELQKRFPYFNKTSLILIIINAVLLFSLFFPSSIQIISHISIGVTSTLTVLNIIIAAVIVFKSVKKQSTYLLLSYIPILIMIVLYLLKSNGYLINFFSFSGIIISFALQVMVLTLALVDSVYRIHVSMYEKIESQDSKMQTLSFVANKIENSIAIFDHIGNMKWCNDNFIKLHNYSNMTCPATIEDISLNDDYKKAFTESFVAKTPSIFETEIETDDSPIWIQTIVSPTFDKENNLQTIALIESNISSIKASEIETKKLQEQLVQSQKMETIGKLAGGIAHDFNNILTPIVGYSDMMLSDMDEDDPLKEDLSIIMKAALRAQKMVKQILTFSRHFKEDIKTISVTEAVHEALNLCQASVSNSISFDFVNKANHATIKADPTQLQQIFINLITNSVHAVNNEGIITIYQDIVIKNKEESIQHRDDLQEGMYVKISICDNGCGIEEENLKKIFDPFYTTKEVGKGTGLGLSVVHGIINTSKGAIIVESKINVGTKAHLYFPISAESVSEINKQEEISISGQEKHILVVDDESYIVRLLKRMLEKHSFKVTGVTNSTEALKCVRQNPAQYNLVITDQTMPEMTGDVLSQQILKLNSNIKIIIMTGYSEVIDFKRAEEIGVSHLIYKPIKSFELLSIINKLLQSKP